MAFLIEQIKEQKILEMEVSFDDFIKENNISESAIIHTMIFEKAVFLAALFNLSLINGFLFKLE